MDQNLSAVLNVPQEAGLLIQRVSENSFADQMGLQGGFFQIEIFNQKLWLGGDIILEILGTSCAKPHSLKSVKQEIEALKAGEMMSLKILRQGKVIDLQQKI